MVVSSWVQILDHTPAFNEIVGWHLCESAPIQLIVHFLKTPCWIQTWQTNCLIYPIIIKMFSIASRTWSNTSYSWDLFNLSETGYVKLQKLYIYLHQRLHITFGYRLSLSSIIIVFEFKVLPVTTKEQKINSKNENKNVSNVSYP